jgi:hypothetical protein
VKREGTAEPSLSKFILENQKQYGLQDNELPFIAGGVFGAANDSVGSHLHHVLLRQLSVL